MLTVIEGCSFSALQVWIRFWNGHEEVPNRIQSFIQSFPLLQAGTRGFGSG
jgi:hypothetical protein